MDLMALRRSLLMMPTAVPGGLPAEYLAVEYLESTGTQYINTGILPFDGIGYDITFLTKSTMATSGDYGCIFGSRHSSGNNDFQMTSYGYPQVGTVRYGSSSGTQAGIAKNTKSSVSLRRMTYTNPAGDQTEISSYTFNNAHNIYLFMLNNNETAAQGGLGCRIYSIAFYNASDNKIADFIPCIRIADSKPGMYDLVGRQFYTNQGTGEFLTDLDNNT